MVRPRVTRAVQPVLLAVLLVAVSVAAARAAPFLYATSDVDGTVSVVDTATRAVVATVPVGVEPVALSAAPDGSRVFVGLRGAPVLATIDTASHAASGQAPADLVGTVDDIAAHPLGSRLYVVALGTCESVTVVDLPTDTVVRRLQAGRAAIRVVVNTAGTRAWVAGTQGITVIDAIRNVTLTRIPLPFVYAMTLHPAGTRLYAASTTDQAVFVLDTASSAQVARIALPGIVPGDIAIAPDGRHVYVLGGDRILVMDTASNAIVATLPLPLPAGFSTSLARLVSDGARLYVLVNHGTTLDNAVLVLDIATAGIEATIPLGRRRSTGSLVLGVGPRAPTATPPAVVTLPPPVPRSRVAGFVLDAISSPQLVGTPFTVRVTAVDASGHPVAEFVGFPTLITPPGSGAEYGPPVNGSRVLTVDLVEAGLGQRITVGDFEGNRGASNAFDVRHGPPPFTATFVVPPDASAAGSPLNGPPTVAMVDHSCNVATESGDRIEVLAFPAGSQAFTTLGARQARGGIAVFDDLRIATPGAYVLRPVGPYPGFNLASGTFQVVEVGTLPAFRNSTLTTLRPATAQTFAPGDILDITTRSGLSLGFGQPSILALRDAAEARLELTAGQLDLFTQAVRLALETPRGSIASPPGSVDASVLVSGGATTVDVHAGVVDLDALGHTVPPGGQVMADAVGGSITDLRLTQAALVASADVATIVALANPTDGSATVTLTARGPDGSVLPGAANPRTVTLPAGGGLHEAASALLALSSGGTTLGTIEITSRTLGVRGTSFLEQPGTGLAAGLPVHGQRVTEAVVPEQPGTNYLFLHNPGPAALALTLRRFDVAGTVVGEASLLLPPRGLALRTASDLFGVLPASRLARIEITGPARFVAHNVAVAGGQAAVFAGQGRAGLAATLYAPLVAELPGVAATSLTLLNPSRLVPLRVALTLQDGAGQPVGTVFDTLQPGVKVERGLRDLFPALPGAGLTGWLEVAGVPAADSAAPPQLTGAVTLTGLYGTGGSVTLPLVAAARASVTAARVVHDADRFSVLAVANPSADRPVSATVTMRALDGRVVERATYSLGARGFRQVGLPAGFVGSVQVTADGDGVAVGGLSGRADGRGLVPLLP